MPETNGTAAATAPTMRDALLQSAQWRNLGPFRGGRVVAVAGDPTRPLVFYMGSTGGGVWKTIDAGLSWTNVSDGYFRTASVGALAVAESDPNVIYAGMGETTIRGNVAHGDGVYGSTDAGKTWRHLGLAETRSIARVRIHPQNPDLVYVAALGHTWGPNPERGLYRSKDGGTTWEQILTRGDKAGAIDLSLDPTNPRILYAAFWEAGRTPWQMTSGGPGSGIFKSTDGGDTWTDLSAAPGLPKGVKGKIGLAVSPARPERIWALIEADGGGFFRSDDGGAHWAKLNEDRELLQRAWYYAHVVADPQDPDTVWAPNVRNWRSTDGGKTFSALPTPHGDNHDIWIDPRNPQRLIQGNDGGACVSFDGGASWSTIYNQPTAEFYHVTTDVRIPYRVYGAQQDNTTLSLPSRSDLGAITWAETYPIGGGESGYIAVRQDNPDITYAGSYGGLLTRYDHRSKQARNIAVWPENPIGWTAGDQRYRFQWTFPIVLSPHDPDTLYVCSNVVHRSRDEGGSWTTISPDLTRNDKSKMGSSGGPITQDNTSVEYYGTIFAFAESPREPGVLWVGSDDGLVHLSRDGGANWLNVTPGDWPEMLISLVDPSPHDAATCYVAATRYKFDDNAPYLYKTTDWGRTWTPITTGIPDGHFTRAIRCDPARRGLLYAGTEAGVYVSFDDGASWSPLQGNLPVVPIHDLAIRDHDLVAATHGRGFWVLDDLTPLHAVDSASVDSASVRQSAEATSTDAPTHGHTDTQPHLFTPRTTVRWLGGGRRPQLDANQPRGYGSMGGLAVRMQQSRGADGEMQTGFLDAGANPPGGITILYYLPQVPEGQLKLRFLDASGTEIKSFTSKGADEGEKKDAGGHGGGDDPKPTTKVGLNRFNWNARYPDATNVPGTVMWAGSVTGPLAPPGRYTVELTVNGETHSATFDFVKDPRTAATQSDLDAQFALLRQIRDKLSETHDTILSIRAIRQQVDNWVERTKGSPQAEAIASKAKALRDALTEIEDQLTQTRSKAHEDPLNFPIQLNNKLAALAGVVASADAAPTEGSRGVFTDLSTRVDLQLGQLREILASELADFNAAVRETELPPVVIPPDH